MTERESRADTREILKARNLKGRLPIRDHKDRIVGTRPPQGLA